MKAMKVSALAASGAFCLVWAAPAAAVVNSIAGACRPGGSGPVFLHAGTSTELIVKGPGVALATSVEATGLRGVAIADPDVTLGGGKKFTVIVDRDIRHGDAGSIRLKYVAGEDSVPVRLVAAVAVRSMSIDGVTPAGGKYTLDTQRDFTLVLRGAGLSAYTPPDGIGLPGQVGVTLPVRLSLLSRTGDEEVRLRVRGLAAMQIVVNASVLRGTGFPSCSTPHVDAASAVTLSFRAPR